MGGIEKLLKMGGYVFDRLTHIQHEAARRGDADLAYALEALKLDISTQLTAITLELQMYEIPPPTDKFNEAGA